MKAERKTTKGGEKEGKIARKESKLNFWFLRKNKVKFKNEG